jgi:hypothetical protein
MSKIIGFSFFLLGAKCAVDGGGEARVELETEIQVSGQVTGAFLIG